MFLRFFKLLLLLIVTVAFLVFAVVNRELVAVSLFPLPYSAEIPVFILAIACFAAGALYGWLMVGMKLIRNKYMLRSEHNRVMALQNEVQALHAEQDKLPAIGR